MPSTIAMEGQREQEMSSYPRQDSHGTLPTGSESESVSISPASYRSDTPNVLEGRPVYVKSLAAKTHVVALDSDTDSDAD
jgi:hypothetical protein